MSADKRGVFFAADEFCLYNNSASVTFLRGDDEFTLPLKNNFHLERLAWLPGLIVQGVFTNDSGEPVRLRRFNLIDAEISFKWNLSKWRFFPIGAVSKRPTRISEKVPSRYEEIRAMYKSWKTEPPALATHPRYDDDRWRESKEVAGIYREDGKGVLLGTAGPGIAYVEVSLFVDLPAVRVLATAEMDDVLVEPGESRLSERIMLLNLPGVEAMDFWAKTIVETHGSRTHRKPLTGWCSYYNDRAIKVSAEDVRGVIEAVRKNKDALLLDTIQVDSCFENTVGDWRANEKFPEGMASLAKEIDEVGSTPGLWLAPIVANDSLPLFKKHPDWFQRNKEGKIIDKSWTAWGGKSYNFDPTHPQVQEFVRSLIGKAVTDGYRYLKLDFNEIDEGVRLYNPKKTRLEAMRDLFWLYREAMGEEVYFLSCSIGMERGAVGFADAERIGPDSVADWDTPYPWSVRESLRATFFHQATHRVWWNNDPDVTYLEPYKVLTPEQCKTWHSAVGISCGAVFISELLGSKDYNAVLRRLEILTPPAQERPRAFDLCQDEWPRYFGFPLVRPWEEGAVLMIWNPKKKPRRLSVDFKKIGLSGRQKYHLWSFWDEKYFGEAVGKWQSPVLAPRDCLVLKITGTKPVPVLVGSTLHISCGASEVKNFLTAADQVRIELSDSGARSGRIYLYSQRRLKLALAENCSVTKIAIHGSLHSIQVEGRVRGGQQHIVLQFID